MIKLNKYPVKFGVFPNGESYLSKLGLNTRSYNEVEWLYESEGELVQLAILKSYLDQEKFLKSSLSVHYLPHSRMDRINDSYAMSLKAITDLVNHLGFDSIKITEPHSDVCIGMLNKSFIEPFCQPAIGHVTAICHTDSLFFPDAGAVKRYTPTMKYAVGFKERDFKSGAIKRLSLQGEVGSFPLIVDDLCSKGGTFVHAAKLLKEHGAKSVRLLVAHCENTIFDGELFDHVDFVFTSSKNVLNKKHPKLILI